jgi:ketosteroid isomerase-like protein
MRWIVSTSLLLLLACSKPAPPAPSADEVRGAIEAQNRAFGEAVHAGDTAVIGALYSTDGAVLPPNATRVTGRAAVSEFWANALTADIASAVLTTEEVFYAGGDTATEIGSAVLSAKDGSVVDEGKYIVVWKQEGGAWRLHRDIWNSNRAPAPAASPESEPPAADAVDAGTEPPPPPR